MKLERKQQLVDILEERNAKLPCPRCKNKKFALLDGYFNHWKYNKRTDHLKLKITNKRGFVPTIIVICENCGFIIPHALGVLEQLPENKKD